MPEGPVITRTYTPEGDLPRVVDRLIAVIEQSLVPAIERLTTALETGSSGVPAPPTPGAGSVLDEIRAAIESAGWSHAAALVDAATADFQGHHEFESLRQRLAAGRDIEVQQLRARLDASRRLNDWESVLDLHDRLHGLLDENLRKDELEREVLQWLMSLVQRRMRSGTVREDVVQLALRVSEAFGHTREGASLRAALPVLRRSVGLCARCGQPYNGLDDACPDCLQAAPQVVVPSGEPGDDDETPTPDSDDASAPLP